MKALTIKELKAGALALAGSLNIAYDDAVKITAVYSSAGAWDDVRGLFAGDSQLIENGARVAGVSLKGFTQTKPRKETKPKQKETKTDNKKRRPSVNDYIIERQAGNLERVTGEIVPASAGPGQLPDNINDIVADAIEDFCALNKIENMKNERQIVFKALCMYIGQNVFKKSKILHDVERERINGGVVYDVARVSALADVWLCWCYQLGKAPFIDDFATFAGVSDSWLYGDVTQSLTPARLDLIKKLQNAQEKGLSALITDGRQNPTGALACLNHWHGWTQTREIIHTTTGTGNNAGALPMFED